MLSILLFANFSCAQDEYLPTDNTTPDTSEVNDPRVEQNCEIDFTSLSSDEVLNISCDLDLNGQTIVLPQNTTLKFDGGSLFNGTFVFNGGLVDGKLLNIDLQISGSVKLIDTHFVFEKEKWDIVEGNTNFETALANRVNINSAITLVKELRGNIFEIDNIDAYVEVGALHFGNYTHREAIQVPSNFHFKMGDDCTLRVQPNGNISYAILSSRGVNNVKISGGHLIGDKYEHTYTTGTEQDTHEFGTGIYFVGVTNSEIDGVTVDDMTGDCFGVHSTRNRNPDGSEKAGEFYSKNILIKNVTFRGARRNNLSFIDIDGLTLENSIIANAGEGGEISNYGDVYDWRGVLPRCNIDLEATRSFDADGNMNISQIVQNITIRNNEFSGAWISDINFYTCDNVDVYGNTFTSGLSNLNAQDIFIHDNTFTHDTNLPALAIAIFMKEFVRVETGVEENLNYQIYNNTIEGFDTGITVGGNNHNVYNNTVTNFVNNGVSIRKGDNNHFSGNTISSNMPASKGYYSFPTGITLTNSSITNEVINVDEYGLLFKNLESNPASHIVIDDCSFSSGFRNVDIRNSSCITVQNSETGTIYQTNNTDIVLINNN